MWRFRLPHGNSDRIWAIALCVGLPAIACITNGVGAIETLVTAALIGGVIAIIH